MTFHIAKPNDTFADIILLYFNQRRITLLDPLIKVTLQKSPMSLQVVVSVCWSTC